MSMRVLNQHLRLSRRRASLFFGMHSGERTLALTEQKGTAEPRAQAGATASATEKEQEEGDKIVNTETGTSQRNRNTFSGRAGTMEQAKPDDEERR